MSEAFDLPQDPFPGAATEAAWLQSLKAEGLSLPDGSSLLRENKGRRWIVGSNCQTLDIFRRYVATLWKGEPKSLSATVEIIRGPAALLLALAEKAADLKQEATALAELREHVGRGDAAHVGLAHLHALSGQEATLSAGRSQTTPVGAQWSKDSAAVDFNYPLRGVTLEVDATLAPDGTTTDLGIRLEWASFPPAFPRNQQAGSPLDLPGSDRATVEIATRLSLSDGIPRILGLWKPPPPPAGGAEPDFLEVALLTVHAARPLPVYTNHTARVEPEPLREPQKMETRVFRGYDSLITETIDSEWVLSDLSQYFGRLGIPFGEGTFAQFVEAGTSIVVRNTRENLVLVGFALQSIGEDPNPDFDSVTVHGFQAPGPFIRTLLHENAGLPDQSAALKRLRDAVAGGTATGVDAASLIGRPGQRSQVSQATGIPHLKRYAWTVGAGGFPQFETTSKSRFLEVESQRDHFSLSTCQVTWHHSPSQWPVRKEPLLLPGFTTETPLDFLDLPRVELKAIAEMSEGSARILAAWSAPHLEPAQDILQILLVELKRVTGSPNADP